MFRKTLWVAGAAIVIVGIIFIAICFPGLRENARLKMGRSNLKQIGLAIHSYLNKYDCYPPAYVLGADGKPWHSWRVLLLPYLGEQELYDRYHFDEPWDGPHNRELLPLRPAVYNPAFATANQKDATTYLAIIGRRTMWPAYFSVRISDVTDGASNTIQLVENIDKSVPWSEPRDLRDAEAVAMVPTSDELASGKYPRRIAVLMADGSVRAIELQRVSPHWKQLLTPSGSKVVIGNDRWPPGLLADPKAKTAKSLEIEEVDIAELPDTRMAPILDGTLDLERTTIYCATLQLAWDQLRPDPLSPVVVGKQSIVTESLNAHPFPTSALSADSFFVGQADLDGGQSEALYEELKEKFPNNSVKMLQRRTDEIGFRILAYLRKSLPFEEQMQRFSEPFQFRYGGGSKSVQSFGRMPTKEDGSSPILTTVVSISDYASADDFVIVLSTSSPRRDEIIMAKIRPESTLRKTWEHAAQRLRKPLSPPNPRELRGKDLIQIPILSLGVSATIDELIDLGVPTKDQPLRYIKNFRQKIRFRLDEKGAELEAAAETIISADAPPGSGEKPRHLIFDKPFLLVLREWGASEPYFFAWIGNADLMQPF